MGTFADLKELVKKKGYGATQYKYINGDDIYLSRGIKEVFLTDEDKEQKLMTIVCRFQKQDYGNAGKYGKESRPGHEYGRYEITDFESEPEEDTAVWVHKTENAVKVYFRFER